MWKWKSGSGDLRQEGYNDVNEAVRYEGICKVGHALDFDKYLPNCAAVFATLKTWGPITSTIALASSRLTIISRRNGTRINARD
jgi:hypothetical protein